MRLRDIDSEYLWVHARDSGSPEGHFFMSGAYLAVAFASAFSYLFGVQLIVLLAPPNLIDRIINITLPIWLVSYSVYGVIGLAYWKLGRSRQVALKEAKRV